MGETKITAKPSEGATAGIISKRVHNTVAESGAGNNGASVFDKNVKLPDGKQKHTPTFYIIQEDRKLEDVDGDNIPDKIAHDEIVEIYAKKQCPAAKRLTNPQDTSDVVIDTYTIIKKTNEISDSLNLCLNDQNLLKKYKKQIFKEMNIDTSHNKTAKTTTGANNKKEEDKEYSEEDEQTFISLINYSKQKIPVFVAAGNEPDSISIESFVDGTTAVGALEPVLNLGAMTSEMIRAEYSSNSDIITQWEQGSYPVKIVRNPNGDVIGYNITNGSTVDVDIEKITRKFNWNYSSKPNKVTGSTEMIGSIEGTSFAAPTAAGKYLRKRFGAACDLPKPTSP